MKDVLFIAPEFKNLKFEHYMILNANTYEECYKKYLYYIEDVYKLKIYKIKDDNINEYIDNLDEDIINDFTKTKCAKYILARPTTLKNIKKTLFILSNYNGDLFPGFILSDGTSCKKCFITVDKIEFDHKNNII